MRAKLPVVTQQRNKDLFYHSFGRILFKCKIKGFASDMAEKCVNHQELLPVLSTYKANMFSKNQEIEYGPQYEFLVI